MAALGEAKDVRYPALPQNGHEAVLAKVDQVARSGAVAGGGHNDNADGTTKVFADVEYLSNPNYSQRSVL